MHYLRLLRNYLRSIFEEKPVKVEQPVEKAKPVSEPKKEKPQKLYLPKCPATLKTSYNEQLAKQEAEKIGKRTLTNLRAYKCQFCDYWHVTHKKNKLKMH